MKFLLIIPMLCCLLLASAQAQLATAPRRGILAGTVTKYGSGEPIRNAEVSITGSADSATQLSNGDEAASQQVTVVTDANGHFRFPGLAPGEYNVTVRKGGFHGFRAPNSHTWQEYLTVTVSAGDSTSDLALAMQPGAVVSGKVTDENGEPMANVQVGALKSIYVNHRRMLRPMGMATTDDNGNYRIFSLEPGRYLVRATVVSDGAAKMRYAPAYFPDATVPSDASALSVRSSDETVADFRMSRVHTAKISGHVSNIGNPAQTQVYLRSVVDDGFSVARSGASVDKNGNFNLTGVLPGDYVLGAFEFQGDNNRAPLSAVMPVRVDGADLKDLNLSLEEAGQASLQGTLRIDGDHFGHPRLDTLRVGLLPAPDLTTSEFFGEDGYSPVGRDGSIHFDRVTPGKYIVSIVANGSGWEDFYTKDVQIGSRDVTDSVITLNASRGVMPVSITVSTDGAYVEGTVKDDDDKPVANAVVIGIPDPALRSQYDLYQRAETDRNGHFQLRGIKPGSYSFYAWNSMEDQSYMDPEFMRGYEGYRVDLSLNPKDRQTLSLKLLSNGLE
jgi:protocatechuate 3,4-dioxygenase beta subunit